MTLPKINNRPALIKALEAAGITQYDVSGRGKALECRVHGRRDMVMFRRKVAKWGGIGNAHSFSYRSFTPYQPGSEHDFNSVCSHHHY